MSANDNVRRGLIAVAGFLSLGIADRVRANDGAWTNAASGVWSDTAGWADGVVAGDGGVAAFGAASGTFYVTNDLSGAVTLSGLSANTNAGQLAVWSIVGGTNVMTAPAVIYTRSDSLSVRASTLAGDTDITITGGGRFYLGDDNTYSGRTIISNGNVRVARDSGFGPVPETLQADAIILDNGGLENDDNSFVLTNAATRGITVTERGGFIGCGYTSAGFVINAPITGTGLLGINFENCPLTLNNPANDYAGGTVVGTNGPGGNTSCSPTLKLGQDEVIPHGEGKGGLKIGTDSSYNNSLLIATLDLNGKTETVNTLNSGPRAAITSSSAGGCLIVGGLGEDGDYRGVLGSGATIEKQGAGTLRLAGAALTGGTVDLKAGTVVAGGPNLGSGTTLLLDGGSLELTVPSGLYEFTGTSGAAPDLGAALTYSGWASWPVKGSTSSTTEFPYNTQYVYRGKWYVPEAGTYSFAKGFDDGGYLVIDGVTVISNATTATRLVVNSVAVGAGWHSVEIRYSQGTGTVGPQFSFRNGILYDPENGGFTNTAELARAKMFTDDGGTNLVAAGYDNVLSARLLLATDSTLTVDDGAGTLVFAGNLTTNVVADPEPVLTVSNGGAPLVFGSSSSNGTPAVLDASVSSAGGIVFTNRVWLRRLPGGSYDMALGAELTLDGAALLGDTALNLTDYSVRVVADDSVGGDGSVAANTDTAVWFDTMRYVDHALTDGSAAAYANTVTLNGGTVGFTGSGTLTYSGTLGGSGNAVKSGTGDLMLTTSESSFTGELRIDAGRVLPADESALRCTSVRLNGGRLVNPAAGDLTLETMPITAVDGGFEVTDAGETMTVNGQVTGVSPVSKWGAGTLVLGGTVINTNFDLYVRAGSVELNKSGSSDAYAVRHLLGVATNLTVRVTGSNGNQIGGGVTLDGGILDLNGHSETIGVLTNTLAGGIVTNGGAAAVTLTVGEGGGTSTFDGVLADGASALALTKTGAGTFALTKSAVAYSAGTRVEGGTLRVMGLTPPKAGLCYWLDAAASASLTLSNGYVVTWGDLGTGGVSFAQSTLAQRPSYAADGINGKPAIRFSDSTRNRLYASKSVSAQTVFIVCRTTSYGGLDGIWGQNGNDLGIRADGATQWQHPGNANTFSYNGAMYINGVSGNTFVSGQPHILTAVSSAPKTWAAAVGDYWGSSTYLRYFRGYIGEVLVYNAALSADQRNAVIAYLQQKWFTGTALAGGQTVTVETDARFAVTNMDLTVTKLVGGGELASEGGCDLDVIDYASFTGTVTGAGALALRGIDGAAGRFLPQSIVLTVRNNGTQPVTLRVEGEATNVFNGVFCDGSNTLGITHAGTGLTYFAGTNSTYTGATRVEAGTAMVQGGCLAQYVRFSPVLMRIGGTYYVTNTYQLSEFQLMLGGRQLTYPAGTTAYATLGYHQSSESPLQAIDGSTATKFFTNYSDANGPNKLVVKLPAPVLFDGYRWYTANDGSGRDPVEWRVEASLDGVNWTQVDYQDYGDNMSAITTTRYALAGVWNIVAMPQMNVFSDVSETTVAAPGTLGVSGTYETVGALDGDGAALLVNAGTLGLNAFTNAVFTGGITGTGTVVKAGAETQTLSGALAFTGEIIVEEGTLDLTGATLTGVTNIIIRAGGELTGTATVDGDLTVTFDGGVYSGSLAVSGALTVSGTVTLGVPDGATYPYYGTLFTYASADEATLEALLQAVKPSPVPVGHAANVRVTATSARLVIAPVGTVIEIR